MSKNEDDRQDRMPRWINVGAGVSIQNVPVTLIEFSKKALPAIGPADVTVNSSRTTDQRTGNPSR